MAGLSWVKNLKRYLYKAPECLGAGYTKLRLIIFQIMNEKIIEGKDKYEPPSKKLCPENINQDIGIAEKKIRKKNVALLLAYSGVNYLGMQKNGQFRTIEKELLNALEKAKFIPADAVNDLHLIHFQRAARTDKGVSAARQIVSFKIAENFNVDTINSHLPEEIRVFGIKRVTKGFNCKNQCVARTYSYTLPTYALAPELHLEYPKEYRIEQETIEKVNSILDKFSGTHCFHNFTSRKDARDPSAKRYIMSFKAEDPFVDEEEFITLKVKGQSFMLHQIRKMVGYTIALMKGLVPENVQDKVFSTEKFPLPMAPGLGLVLEDIHYDPYNRKFGNDGTHSSLTWDEVDKELGTFRKNYIFSNIVKTEITERPMFEWTLSLSTFKFTEEEEEVENGTEEEE